MAEENIELLKRAGIKESLYDYCYIDELGHIFTPVMDANGNIVKSGKERYDNRFNKCTETKKETFIDKIRKLVKR